MHSTDKVVTAATKKTTIARKISTRSNKQTECLPRDLETDSKCLKKNGLSSIKSEKKNLQKLEKTKHAHSSITIAAKTDTKKADSVVGGIKLNGKTNEIQSGVTVGAKIDAEIATRMDQVQSEATINSSEQGGARPSTSLSTPTPQPLSNTSEFQQGDIFNNQQNYQKIWSQEQKINQLEAQVESLQNVSEISNRSEKFSS